MRWQTAWQMVKDILLTGTGLAIILSQIWSKSPSDIMLVAGLALTVPSAASHAVSILSGPGAPSSSGPSDAHGGQPSPPSSSSPPGGTGD